jgi:hypothetical protein
MSRTGKIAKLPSALREELNHQLERGVSGRILVEWLNAHPAVQAVLRESFEGKPVNEPNLCAWRRGGFADWQTRREFYDQVREVATDAGDLEKVAANMADHAARLLSTHYAIALSSLPPPPRAASSGTGDDSGPNPYASLSRLKPLASITRHVVALRRSDHIAARVKMEARAFAFASDAQSAAKSNTHPPAGAASPAARIPDQPETEHQPKLSQIKVGEIQANPATVAARNASVPPSPNPCKKPPASLFPPRLNLKLPPLLPHLLNGPPVPAHVA